MSASSCGKAESVALEQAQCSPESVEQGGSWMSQQAAAVQRPKGHRRLQLERGPARQRWAGTLWPVDAVPGCGCPHSATNTGCGLVHVADACAAELHSLHTCIHGRLLVLGGGAECGCQTRCPAASSTSRPPGLGAARPVDANSKVPPAPDKACAEPSHGTYKVLTVMLQRQGQGCLTIQHQLSGPHRGHLALSGTAIEEALCGGSSERAAVKIRGVARQPSVRRLPHLPATEDPVQSVFVGFAPSSCCAHAAQPRLSPSLARRIAKFHAWDQWGHSQSLSS